MTTGLLEKNLSAPLFSSDFLEPLATEVAFCRPPPYSPGYENQLEIRDWRAVDGHGGHFNCLWAQQLGTGASGSAKSFMPGLASTKYRPKSWNAISSARKP
jgi:hypothetical protein